MSEEEDWYQMNNRSYPVRPFLSFFALLHKISGKKQIKKSIEVFLLAHKVLHSYANDTNIMEKAHQQMGNLIFKPVSFLKVTMIQKIE